MNRQLILRPEAESDIAEAAEWYDQQRVGLSSQFRSALDRTFASIEENPRLNALVYRGLRRALVRRFPFGVFYVLHNEAPVVVAVFHTARDPRLWRARFK
jgi:plasmid stabilization system protein ParE